MVATSGKGVEFLPARPASFEVRTIGSLLAVVDGQVGLGQFELQQVGSAGELQGGRLAAEGAPGGQDVGDVFGAEGRQFQPVVDGTRHRLGAVHLDQGEDPSDMPTRVHALGQQPVAVGLGARRQGQPLHHQTLLAGAGALCLQHAHVIWILDVAVPIQAARVAGLELVMVVNAYPVGVGLERQALAGQLGRHRVMIRFQRHPTRRRGAHRADASQVVAVGIEWPQPMALVLEPVDRALVSGGVDAHVGHRVDPMLGRHRQRGEVWQLQPGQEVLLHVAHRVLHAALLVAGAHVAGTDLEAPVTGKVGVLRIEHRGGADQALQHGRFEVVDHHALRHAAKRGKGMLVAAQEELHRLRDGELQIQAPAVAQHHHEQAQPASRGAHADGAPFTPVHLRALARREVELEEGRMRTGADARQVVLNDAASALEAEFAQALQDLLGAVGVGIEPAHDLALEGVELAGVRPGPAQAGPELAVAPPGHRARIQTQRSRCLRHAQLLAAQVVADLAIGLIVEHGGAPTR